MPWQEKGVIRSMIRQLIDDVAATQWPEADLDYLSEGTLDELWSDLLEGWEWVRTVEDTVVPNASGVVTGQLTLRWHRIQKVTRAGREYSLVDPKDVVLNSDGTVVSAPDCTYMLLGSELHAFPIETTDISIRYSGRPDAYTELEDDDGVEWPDGFHMAYVYEIAARAMEKGDRESSATFQKRADMAMFRLKAWLRKQAPGPITPFSITTAAEYGGV